MRRELARLQDEEAIGEVLQTANVDLITMDAIQSACDRGPDAAQALLDALSD
jgi:hypothetical protein